MSEYVNLIPSGNASEIARSISTTHEKKFWHLQNICTLAYSVCRVVNGQPVRSECKKIHRKSGMCEFSKYFNC